MNKIVKVKIKDTVNLNEKVGIVRAIIDAARSKSPNYLLESFLMAFNTQFAESASTNGYILEKETWESEIDKCNWKWNDVVMEKDNGIIIIEHNPMSNYTDLLHTLLYAGVEMKNISVDDGLFGTYRLIDTNRII